MSHIGLVSGSLLNSGECKVLLFRSWMKTSLLAFPACFQHTLRTVRPPKNLCRLCELVGKLKLSCSSRWVLMSFCDQKKKKKKKSLNNCLLICCSFSLLQHFFVCFLELCNCLSGFQTVFSGFNSFNFVFGFFVCLFDFHNATPVLLWIAAQGKRENFMLSRRANRLHVKTSLIEEINLLNGMIHHFHLFY